MPAAPHPLYVYMQTSLFNFVKHALENLGCVEYQTRIRSSSSSILSMSTEPGPGFSMNARNFSAVRFSFL
jgi:hypothetical protein